MRPARGSSTHLTSEMAVSAEKAIPLVKPEPESEEAFDILLVLSRSLIAALQGA